jgi:hypothetical protein
MSPPTASILRGGVCSAPPPRSARLVAEKERVRGDRTRLSVLSPSFWHMHVKIVDDVLRNRLALAPAYVDGAAIVDAAVDARETEERLEITEMAGGECRSADVRPAIGALTGVAPPRWTG